MKPSFLSKILEGFFFFYNFLLLQTAQNFTDPKSKRRERTQNRLKSLTQMSSPGLSQRIHLIPLNSPTPPGMRGNQTWPQRNIQGRKLERPGLVPWSFLGKAALNPKLLKHQHANLGVSWRIQEQGSHLPWLCSSGIINQGQPRGCACSSALQVSAIPSWKCFSEPNLSLAANVCASTHPAQPTAKCWEWL